MDEPSESRADRQAGGRDGREVDSPRSGPAVSAGRLWRRWSAGAAAAAVVIVVAGVVLFGRSDWWNTDYAPARIPAPAAGQKSLPSVLHAVWRAKSTPSDEAAVTGSTVITATEHRLRAHDPRTGAVRWSYGRADTGLCAWAATPTAVIAVWREGANCGDLIAFDPASGKRLWYLNADLAGRIRLVGAPSIVVAVSEHAATGFYTETGGQAWTYNAGHCPITDAIGGATAFAMVRSCAGNPNQVIARNSWTGTPMWTAQAAGNAVRLLSADAAVLTRATVDGRPTATVYNGSGRVTATHRLAGTAAPRGTISAAQSLAVFCDGHAVDAVSESSGAVVWSSVANGAPWVGDTETIVPTQAGFSRLDTATGAPLGSTQVRRARGARALHGALTTDRIGRLVVLTTATTVTVLG